MTESELQALRARCEEARHSGTVFHAEKNLPAEAWAAMYREDVARLLGEVERLSKPAGGSGAGPAEQQVEEAGGQESTHAAGKGV